MVKRSDDKELGFEIEIAELSKTGRKNVIASVETSKKEAEIEALKLRLQGKSAYIQNGLNGMYEVLSSENQLDIRKLDASFKPLGCGVFTKLGSPEWDKGSIWTLHSVDNNGSILVSKVEDTDEEENTLTSELQIKSAVRGKTASAPIYFKVGDTIDYVDSEGRFASGTILDVDHKTHCYVAQSNRSFEKEYIPFTLTAFDKELSEDPSADDNFEYTPEEHSEEAYDSENAESDDDYSQNETDVSGFESMDEFDFDYPLGGEDVVEATILDDLASGLDDTQKDDYSSFDTDVEAVFDFDFEGFDKGLDDTLQLPEDLQNSVDHYDFDAELYALASTSTDVLDDLEQLPEDLQDSSMV